MRTEAEQKGTAQLCCANSESWQSKRLSNWIKTPRLVIRGWLWPYCFHTVIFFFFCRFLSRRIVTHLRWCRCAESRVDLACTTFVVTKILGKCSKKTNERKITQFFGSATVEFARSGFILLLYLTMNTRGWNSCGIAACRRLFYCF